MHLRQVVLKKITIFFCVFLWFKPRRPWGGSILDPGATIYKKNKVKENKAMLHTKFQAVSLEKKIFKYILLANPGSPGIGPFWTTLVKRPLDNAIYQISSISAKRFWRRFLNAFLFIFMLKTHDPLGRGHFWPWDLHLNKFGKGLLGNVRYKISRIWVKWFWRRRFLKIFSMYFYGSNSGTSGEGPFWTQGTLLEQTW